MKILVVHQYYLFPGAPGGSRFTEFARLWTAQGHEVNVIAGNLNYATGEVAEHLRDVFVRRVEEAGIPIYRCHVPRTYSKSYAGRLWAFFGWTFSASVAALKVPRPDVVIATSPPLIAVIPGWVAARVRWRRAAWVFEIRDLWPESAITTGVVKPDSLLARVAYQLERWACASADAVNVLTPAFRADLLKRGLAAASKIWFVPNGADVEQFQPGPRDNEMRRELGWGDRFVVMYAGAHGRANALGQLVEAAALLKDREDILIACVGDGPERKSLEESARQRGLGNIRFHGARPKEAMPAVVNACDVGAAVLQRNPTFLTVYPNKVFDYMACARPTLLGIDGVAREMVCDQAQAGVFVTPEDPRAIADAIVRLKDAPEERRAMGARGRAWVAANVARDALSARYLELLGKLAADGGGRRRR
jgi:glycosyltransferase involved in cell wall biosynthesis